MARYTYRCRTCGVSRAINLPLSAQKPEKLECYECGENMFRSYKSVNFVLKGGGWYSKSDKGGNNG